MTKFTIEEVLEATGAQLLRRGREGVFTGVSTDTRKIKQGDLFVALTGEKFDGHDFTDKACDNGAAGVLVAREEVEVSRDAAVIAVSCGTLKALQKLAGFHRARFNIPVVGVTGSNGKTTTKEMIAAVLSRRFNVLKTEGNQNNEIGLPLTLLKLSGEHQAVVAEMAMRGRGQIRELAEIARPTVAVITNVSQTHVELLGSIENIAAAKSELLEVIDENGLAILNGDNKYVRDMGGKSKARKVFYGLDGLDFVRAENIDGNAVEMKTAFICRGAGGSFSFPAVIPALGVHNVYNALAAIAAGWELGLNAVEIQEGLLNFKPADMRQTIMRKGQYTIINDAYNASPLSMAAAIEALAELAEERGRKIAVLGDMLELGEEAAKAHEKAGEFLAEKGVDALVTVGDLAKIMAVRAAEKGVPHVFACTGHEHAKRELEKILRPGDTILFKGSRGMEMEKVLELLEF